MRNSIGPHVHPNRFLSLPSRHSNELATLDEHDCTPVKLSIPVHSIINLFVSVYICACGMLFLMWGFSPAEISKPKQRIYYGRIVQEMFGCCAEPAGLFWFGPVGSSEKKRCYVGCVSCVKTGLHIHK